MRTRSQVWAPRVDWSGNMNVGQQTTWLVSFIAVMLGQWRQSPRLEMTKSRTLISTYKWDHLKLKSNNEEINRKTSRRKTCRMSWERVGSDLTLWKIAIWLSKTWHFFKKNCQKLSFKKKSQLKRQFLAIKKKKKASFWHSNGNFPECQEVTVRSTQFTQVWVVKHSVMAKTKWNLTFFVSVRASFRFLIYVKSFIVKQIYRIQNI